MSPEHPIIAKMAAVLPKKSILLFEYDLSIKSDLSQSGKANNILLFSLFNCPLFRQIKLVPNLRFDLNSSHSGHVSY